MKSTILNNLERPNLQQEGILNGIFESKIITLYDLMVKFELRNVIEAKDYLEALAYDARDIVYDQKKKKELDVKHVVMRWGKSLEVIRGCLMECFPSGGVYPNPIFIKTKAEIGDTLESMNHWIHPLTDRDEPTWESLHEIVEKIAIVNRFFQQDCEDSLFLIITPENKQFFTTGFSVVVRKAFPDLNEDMRQACQCYACGFWTASGFHSLRILEAGVQHLAKRFKIPLSETNGRFKDWQKLLEEIKPKINTLNSRTVKNRQKAAIYNKIISHLYEVKDERNDVLHAKSGKTKMYPESRARQVLTETIEFMEDYSDLLEPGYRQEVINSFGINSPIKTRVINELTR